MKPQIFPFRIQLPVSNTSGSNPVSLCALYHICSTAAGFPPPLPSRHLKAKAAAPAIVHTQGVHHPKEWFWERKLKTWGTFQDSPASQRWAHQQQQGPLLLVPPCFSRQRLFDHPEVQGLSLSLEEKRMIHIAPPLPHLFFLFFH